MRVSRPTVPVVEVAADVAAGPAACGDVPAVVDGVAGREECALDFGGAVEFVVEVEFFFDPAGEVAEELFVGGCEVAWAVSDEAEGADEFSAGCGDRDAGVEADGVVAGDVGVGVEAFVEEGVFDDDAFLVVDGGGAERGVAGERVPAAAGGRWRWISSTGGRGR